MGKTIRVHINGIPYGASKVRGRVGGMQEWSKAVIDTTYDLPKVQRQCKMRVTFLLPSDKYPKDHPYGPDLDNLMKRLWDALGSTVFSEVPGRDGCVEHLEVSKRCVDASSEAGAEIEIEDLE